MPHEFKNLSNLSHDTLGVLVAGVLASAAFFGGLALFQWWKRRRKSMRREGPSPPKIAKGKWRRRR